MKGKPLTENRKILLVTDTTECNRNETFNIPSLSEIDQPPSKQLEDIESQIKNVKSRLGLKIDEEVEEAELRRLVENSRKKPVDIINNERSIIMDTSRDVQESIPSNKDRNESLDDKTQDGNVTKEHSKIVFSKDDFRSPSRSPPKRKSIMNRLGKYGDTASRSVLSRLGSYSKNENHKESHNRNGEYRSEKINKLRETKELYTREKNKKMSEEKDGGFNRNSRDLRSHLSQSGSVLSVKKVI